MSLDDVRIDISPLAKQVGLWLVENSDNGLSHLRRGSDLQQAFPDASPRELSKAIAELEGERLARSAGGIGREVPQPFPTPSTYAVFDPIAIGTDPHIDACELIRRILGEGKSQAAGSYSIGAPDLLNETGWPHRRLNPALSLVIAQVDDAHVSKVLDGEFAARSFFVSPSDELALERFLKRVGG